jgi:nitrogenase-stabilizing/protective protein
MKRCLETFYDLTDIEEYFDFFDIEYDKSIVQVKRFHILKEYGTMIKKGFENLKNEEERLLDFLKFSLLKVYSNFKNGYAPSAADVWGMFDGGKLSGCLSCSPQQKGGSCGC